MEKAIYDSGDQGMLQIEQTVMGIYLNCPELLYEDPTRPEIFEIEAHRSILNAIYKGLKGGEYNLAVYYENLPKELETYATQLNDSFVSRQQLDNCLEILKERYVKKAGASILQDVIEGKVDLNAAIDEIMKIQTKNESTKYVLTKVSHIEEVDTEWIIPDLIPKYDITILGGDGGCGKTTFLTNLMAKLSSGQGMFFEEYNVTRQPMRIAYFSKEDETSRILKKKFRLQGANMDLLGTFDLDDVRLSEVLLNTPVMEKIIRINKPNLLILDPLEAFIDSKVNMSARNQMREVTNSLRLLCKKYKVTCIILMHTNKMSQVSGRNRLADSSDLWDSSRSVLIFGETPERGINYISHEKHNYSSGHETILFSVDSDGIPQFEGFTDKKDRDYVSGAARKEFNEKFQEAVAFILDALADKEVEASELLKAAKEKGIAEKTFNRARSALKKQNKISSYASSKGKGRGTTCIWHTVH